MVCWNFFFDFRGATKTRIFQRLSAFTDTRYLFHYGTILCLQNRKSLYNTMPKRKKKEENDSDSRLVELERSMRLTGHVEQDEFTSQSDFVFDFSKTTVRFLRATSTST